MKQETADASVVLSAYTQERWGDLVAAVASIERQTLRPREIIVVADHNPRLLSRLQSDLPSVVALANHNWRGATGARNAGASIARGEIVVFMDDDALAAPDWLENLLVPYADQRTLGVGGKLLPIWQAGRPAWFPDEFAWVVGCSFRGMPVSTSPIRNLVAANMSVRRDVYWELGGFRPRFGKVGTWCQPEETDLCVRGLQAMNGRYWMYTPDAVVYHRVPERRARVRYFLMRCYQEGAGKAMVVGFVGSRDGLSSERRYTFRVLPRGVLRGARDALRGDTSGFSRALAIGAGLTATTLGYAVASLSPRQGLRRGIKLRNRSSA